MVFQDTASPSKAGSGVHELSPHDALGVPTHGQTLWARLQRWLYPAP